MSPGIILLIVVVMLLLGSLPNWPYSRNWGYAPLGGFGVLAIVIMVMLVMDRV
jgi:hypothetical protein